MAGFLVGDRPSYTPTVDTFNGTGAQTAFTLTQETTTDAAIVFISGVGQLPTGAYSISGTTLTFTSAPPSGTSNIWVTYNQPTGTTAIPSDGSISTAKLADDAVTLAKLAAGTDGELITWDASGNPTTVGVGTAAQVLTSNGAGAAPTFQDAAGGAFEFVASASGTGVATIDMDNVIDSSYDRYLLLANGLYSSTAASISYLRVGTGATPTYQTANYQYAGNWTDLGGSAADSGSTGTSAFQLTLGQGDAGSSYPGMLTMWIHTAGAGYGLNNFSWQYFFMRSSPTYYTNAQGSGIWNANGTRTDITSLRFMASSGNINADSIRLYGVKNA